MRHKSFKNLLIFSLFGIAMWFFGNLYEGIVLMPNTLFGSVQKLQAWQNLFVESNPAYFYLIANLAVVATWILFFRTPKESTDIKRLLKYASLILLAAIVLSVYIITQINLKFFFGDLSKYDTVQIHSAAVLWNVLNSIRVVLVGAALVFMFRANVETQKA